MTYFSSHLSDDLYPILKKDGFFFLTSSKAEKLLSHYGFQQEEWKNFVKTWDNLETDTYMADGGSYRKRRYATYSINSETITLEAHQPHYQSRDYNNLNGGVERWFAPIEESNINNSALHAILKATSELASKMHDDSQNITWHTELHQFRIETGTHIKGKPTPEGLHRDGVDFVLILMVKRENIQQGVTTIYALDKKTELSHFTLEHPLDLALIDDHRVFHGVTEIEPQDPNKIAYRDVLVVTLRKK